MAKYIDADILKAKLDEHYGKYQSKYMETRTPYTQGLIDALDLAEQVIDSLQQEQTKLPPIGYAETYYQKGLHDGFIKGRMEILEKVEEIEKRKAEPILVIKEQEQPEVDFKIEERKWGHDAVDNIFPEDGDFMSEVDFRKILKDTARHFYDLGQRSHPKISDNSLGEEIEGMYQALFGTDVINRKEMLYLDTFEALARHFAKWGADHLKK